MPSIIFAPSAIRDIQRPRDFLEPKDTDAARRASAAIRQGVKMLGAYPRMGRMVDDLPEEYREWLIDFGDSGYVVRYRVEAAMVIILAVRHQKEVGYK
jgi:plasmid stabilization system protein ParE